MTADWSAMGRRGLSAKNLEAMREKRSRPVAQDLGQRKSTPSHLAHGKKHPKSPAFQS
jgi:hypothetical protein